MQRATHNGAALKDVSEQQRCARQLVGGWLEITHAARYAVRLVPACSHALPPHTQIHVSLLCSVCAHTQKIDCVYSRERVLIPKGVPMRKGLDSSESLSTQAGTGLGLLTSDYTIYTNSHALCCVCTHSKNRLCVLANES